MSQKKDLISIIIPVYKVEKYLTKCVESVFFQTYTNLEIFLVDDGSPDNCGMMCDEFALKDNRVKVIHKKNGGLADARNAAIDVATGEWIVFVDSDDFVEPDYVENLYMLTQKYDCKVACSRYRYVFEDLKENILMNECQEMECCYDKWEALKYLFLQQHVHTGAWGKIYHRSLFATGIRYPFGLVYEDLPTTYLLLLQCDKVGFSFKRTYNYLLRSTSIEGSEFYQGKSESAMKIILSIESHFEELTPVLPAVKSRLFSLAMHVLLAMPKDYDGDDKNFLMRHIKRNRMSILFGKLVRPKARFAAFLSFLGISACRRIFSKMKSDITFQRKKSMLNKV